MTINIFDKENKLDCSTANGKFIFGATSLWQSISDCLYLIEHNEIDSATEIFSNTFQSFFSKEPSSINQLKKSVPFFGEYGKQFSETYFRLLDLWTDLQDERISHLTGDDDITINIKGLTIILKKAKEKLESILKVI